MAATNSANFAYSLTSTGDYSYFDIAAGSTNLRTAAWIDKGAFSISIIVTNSTDGFSLTNNFNITVDEASVAIPVFVVSAQVQNGSTDGTTVGTVETVVAGATFSLADGRTDLFYLDGADLKLTNAADWGGLGVTNYVTLRAVKNSTTNELVVAASMIAGSPSPTVFRFR